jgi:magnesium chelatase subunit D
MARVLRAEGVVGLVIDTGNRASPQLAELAAIMGAACLPLPRADAEGVSRAVSAAL